MENYQLTTGCITDNILEVTWTVFYPPVVYMTFNHGVASTCFTFPFTQNRSSCRKQRSRSDSSFIFHIITAKCNCQWLPKTRQGQDIIHNATFQLHPGNRTACSIYRLRSTVDFRFKQTSRKYIRK